MKFNLKMIAIASAMVSMAGAAQADLVGGTTNNNGSLVLTAFNVATRDWYMRDTGFLMNAFLPSSVTTLAGDGGVTGNKTPEAGLSLNKTNTASFADAAFGTWLSAQTVSDVRWFVSAVDNVGTATASSTNFKRLITSSANLGETALNSNVDSFVSTANAGGLSAFFGTGTLSKTGAGAAGAWDNNFNFGTDSLASIGGDAGLFYFSRLAGTSGASATGGAFENSMNKAVVTLAANGDFSYTLAAAEAPSEVPVPAAVWLLGSGLMALGGAARRRKAAAKA